MRHPSSDNRAAQFMFASPRSAKHVCTPSCAKAFARMSYTRGLASLFIVATPHRMVTGEGTVRRTPWASRSLAGAQRRSDGVAVDRVVRLHIPFSTSILRGEISESHGGANERDQPDE